MRIMDVEWADSMAILFMVGWNSGIENGSIVVYSTLYIVKEN